MAIEIDRMDIERQRVQDDLRGILAGDVDCDAITSQLYASDASIYEMVPLGVICPRNINDVVTAAQYASSNDLSVHPRGAGSGVAGESLGRGLVLDFSRYMRRVVVSADGSHVTAQSGASLSLVNRNLRPYGRWFGPDPVTRSITTMEACWRRMPLEATI